MSNRKSSKRTKTTKNVMLFLTDVFNLTKNKSLVLGKTIFRPNDVPLCEKHGIANNYGLKLLLMKNLLEELKLDGEKYYRWIGRDLSDEETLIEVADELHTHVYNVKRDSKRKKEERDSQNTDTQRRIKFQNDTVTAVVDKNDDDYPTLLEQFKNTVDELRLEIARKDETIVERNKRIIQLKKRLGLAAKNFEKKNQAMDEINEAMSDVINVLNDFFVKFVNASNKHKLADKINNNNA